MRAHEVGLHACAPGRGTRTRSLAGGAGSIPDFISVWVEWLTSPRAAPRANEHKQQTSSAYHSIRGEMRVRIAEKKRRGRLMVPGRAPSMRAASSIPFLMGA